MKMQRMLSELQGHNDAWAFLQPVNRDEVPDYYDVIKHPMDLSLVEHKLHRNQYNTLEEFVSDANLVFSNCIQYNPQGTIYAKNAVTMQKFLESVVEKYSL